MEWQDEAIVLSARRYGESGVIAALLTREHGRHMGMVRGGAGGAKRGVLQPGNHVRATWRARLAEHLGHSAALPEARAARGSSVTQKRRERAEENTYLRDPCAMDDRADPENRIPRVRICILTKFRPIPWSLGSLGPLRSPQI